LKGLPRIGNGNDRKLQPLALVDAQQTNCILVSRGSNFRLRQSLLLGFNKPKKPK
jgi:hypothetical protein